MKVWHILAIKAAGVYGFALYLDSLWLKAYLAFVFVGMAVLAAACWQEDAPKQPEENSSHAR